MNGQNEVAEQEHVHVHLANIIAVGDKLTFGKDYIHVLGIFLGLLPCRAYTDIFRGQRMKAKGFL